MIEIFYDLMGLNKAIFIAINHATNFSIVPIVLQIVSLIFNISNFAIYYLICCVYLYYKWSHNHDTNSFWNGYDYMFKVGVSYALFGFVYAGLKFSINLPRPFCSIPVAEFRTIADLTHERCLSSFPSSHFGLGILVVYYLWKFLNFKQKVFAILVLIALFLSRIALAMHYPSDLLYSPLIVYFVIKLSQYLVFLFRVQIKTLGSFMLKLLYKI